MEDYLGEYDDSSNTSSSNNSSGSDIGRNLRTNLSKSDQDQYDYENPIEAFHKRGMETSTERLKEDLDSPDHSDEEEGNLSARGLNPAQCIRNMEINVRQTIIEGSFLPVTLLAHQGHFPVNDYVIDHSQGAKLVHYIGTYGKIKALKTFLTKYGMDLAATDMHGQTIVHYAARRGELNMLKYLNEVGSQFGVSLQMPNAHGLAPIMYTMLN